jgi:DNA replication protein DnaC
MINTSILPVNLKQLRLSSFYDNWERVKHQAENERWSYDQFLAVLCDRELANRKQQRIARALRESKIPISKTLDNFNFQDLTSINAPRITAFAENTKWVKDAKNLLLFGPSGVGKTHIACAIGRRLIENGIPVLFTKTTMLVQKLQEAYLNRKLPDALNKLARFDLLILDDIGYVKKNELETNVLFELINDRYESKSVLITSNQSFDKWDDIFPNPIMATAAIDRLIHRANIINFNEQSYRKKTALKAQMENE